jgi:hypothetical protein
MRLPFALPSKLHAFSEEFLSAFDAEADSLPPLSSRQDTADAADAHVTTVHTFPSVTQSRSIAAAASETASLIASSFRAFVPIALSDDKPLSSSSATCIDAPPAPDAELHCRDTQESVDRELASFSRAAPSSALLSLLSAAGEALRRNYMRASFALLLLGLLLLYLL